MKALAHNQEFGVKVMPVRGRPPVTRARVLRYWDKHGPCAVRQIARELGMDRCNVKRILRRFADMPAVMRTQMR